MTPPAPTASAETTNVRLAPVISRDRITWTWSTASRTPPLAAVRSALAPQLAAARAPQQTVDDALIVVSELLTNAYLHARLADTAVAELRIELSAGSGGRSLRIAVTDHAGITPRLREALAASADDLLTVGGEGVEDSGGRGLAVVRNLAARVDVAAVASGGKTVAAVLAVP